MKATKSGHKIYEQNCWNEYIKADNKEFKGYEYYISSCHILAIYEDGELVKSVELSTPKWTHDNWAQYYINQLIIKSTNL